MHHWADYVIFVAFLAVSVGIGLYHALTGGRQRTTEEFIMADRKLQVLPTTLSMLVSFQSAIMIIGGTAEVYTGGVQLWIMVMIHFPLSILIVQAYIIPWLYPMKITSVYKFFELRFGNKEVRIFAAILGIISNLLYMGTAMFAPAVALETATGFPTFASIPIMAVVCTIYTALGGMKAVIWTDVFQFSVMVMGMLAVLIKGFMSVDGFGSALQLLDSEGRLKWADFSPDPTVRHTAWGLLVGGTSSWAAIYGLSQGSVQRFCALETMQKAKTSLLLNIPFIWALECLTFMTGITVVAYYINFHCDPIASGTIKKSNELLPHFVREQFLNAPGFSGLFLATLYSGALSSVSSSLSGSAANAWDDILSWKLGHMPELHAAILNKMLVIFFGAISVGVAFVVATIPGPIMQVSIAVGAAALGPLFGLFIVSGVKMFSWCRSRAVLVGGMIGFVFVFWLSFGSTTIHAPPPLPYTSIDNCTGPVNVTQIDYEELRGVEKFYSVSYTWYGLIGALTTVVTSLLISLILNKLDKTEKIEVLPDHLFLDFWPKRGGYKGVPVKETSNPDGPYPAEKEDAI